MKTREFLRKVYGRGPYHLVFKKEGGPIDCWKTNHPIRAIKQHNGYNCYFQHNPIANGTVNGRRVSKDEVHCARYAHVDLDPRPGVPIGKARKELWARIQNAVRDGIVPQPTIIVMTGRGYQLYWRFERPMHNIEVVEDINKWLALKLGGDAVSDVSRLMRIPGTMNFPSEGKIAKNPGCKPKRSKVERCDMGRVYRTKDFGRLPKKRKKVAVSYERREMPRRTGRILRASAEVVAESDRSKVTWRLINELIECGLDDDEIANAILASNWDKYDHTRLVRQIERARGS